MPTHDDYPDTSLSLGIALSPVAWAPPARLVFTPEELDARIEEKRLEVEAEEARRAEADAKFYLPYSSGKAMLGRKRVRR